MLHGARVFLKQFVEFGISKMAIASQIGLVREFFECTKCDHLWEWEVPDPIRRVRRTVAKGRQLRAPSRRSRNSVICDEISSAWTLGANCRSSNS